MSGIATTLEGSEAADASAARAARELENPIALYDDIGVAMVISTQRRFETETGPDGNPWPPSLRAQATGGKTLTDTARLRSSITHDADGGGVEWGTNVIYGAIHQMGGVITAKSAKGLAFVPFGSDKPVFVQSVTMPARPYLGIDGEDLVTIEAIVDDFLAKVTGGGDAG